jgi:predicted nucleotidyltransferase
MPKMGRNSQGRRKAAKRPRSGLAQALFSRVQQRVLGILFGSPDSTFHASEIIRLAGSGSGAVQRELAKLAAAGLVTTEKVGNRQLYQANRTSPIFRELRGLVAKTVGLVDPIESALAPYRKLIEAAFIYGSVARGSDTSNSDIDLMIVSNELSYSEIFAALHKAETILRRKISPSLVTLAEWKRKLAADNHFVGKVSRQPRLFVLGSGEALA